MAAVEDALRLGTIGTTSPRHRTVKTHFFHAVESLFFVLCSLFLQKIDISEYSFLRFSPLAVRARLLNGGCLEQEEEEEAARKESGKSPRKMFQSQSLRPRGSPS